MGFFSKLLRVVEVALDVTEAVLEEVNKPSENTRTSTSAPSTPPARRDIIIIPVAPVGSGLQTVTKKIQSYNLLLGKHPDKRIVLVDTPGFGSWRDDGLDTLKRVRLWLNQSNRWTGAREKSVHRFNEICGTNPSRKVVLVTTMWDRFKQDQMSRLEAYEVDILQNWMQMMDESAVHGRSRNTEESADAILEYFL
ncbi:hypothetical protein H0H93_012973 [Arthromyces matolae]|nr:hypothetical protein H0H93_012973 [Arthromyces matolae]